MTKALKTVCDLVRYGVTRFEEAGLFYGHGADNAFDEAAFMVLEALRLAPERLEAFWHARVTEEEREAVLSLFTARTETRKPACYLMNRAYLQGLPFYIDERAIVPRSFIAEILHAGEGPLPAAAEAGRILDLCTGSGCLAVLAAQMFPEAAVDAADLSADALAVARENVAFYGLEERVTLYRGDLFAALPAGARYDLIIANPPYVDAEGMACLPPEFRAEPETALAGGEDGLDIVRRIVEAAPGFLADGGVLVCEIGRCAPALQEAFPALPFSWLESANSEAEVFFLCREDWPAGGV